LIEPDVMLGNRLATDPFTSQLILASCDM
jgi:hypothetical protein